MIQNERIKILNDREVLDKPYVLYWMQSSQRTEYNHALEFAQDEANRLKKPLVVYFGLTENFPEANARHFRFMLEGLLEVKRELEGRGIKLQVMRCSPEDGALELSKDAALLVTDRGYLRIQKSWRRTLAEKAPCRVIQVESDVLVPVEETSNKEEYSAATIRRKIERKLPDFSLPLQERECEYPSMGLVFPQEEFVLDNIEDIMGRLNLQADLPEVISLRGGTSHAKEKLEDFVERKLDSYAEHKNEPSGEFTSDLSPYLHFGQISPLYVYLRLRDIHSENKRVFLDELIVRRELAINFVEYNEHYDSYAAITSFARATLEKHRHDEREWLYSKEELENGLTHDPYWNAAELEMVFTGKMNGYMRMYWGKKIIEWSATPEDAYDMALYLNNRYNIDGRDPNGFAGVAWCFGKHDRPWKEREIFGSVRFMNDKGLKRKFNMEAYLEKVDRIKKRKEEIKNG